MFGLIDEGIENKATGKLPVFGLSKAGLTQHAKNQDIDGSAQNSV